MGIEWFKPQWSMVANIGADMTITRWLKAPNTWLRIILIHGSADARWSLKFRYSTPLQGDWGELYFNSVAGENDDNMIFEPTPFIIPLEPRDVYLEIEKQLASDIDVLIVYQRGVST